MKAPEHIDEILRKSLENFHPNPPAEVWAHLEQNLSNPFLGSTQTSLTKAAKLIKAFKSASILSKVAMVASLPALVGIIYFAQPKPKELPIQKEPVEQLTYSKPLNEVIEPVGITVEPKAKENKIKQVATTLQKPGKQVEKENSSQAESISNTEVQINQPAPKMTINQVSTPTVTLPNTKVQNGGESKLKKEDPLLNAKSLNENVSNLSESKIEVDIPNTITPNNDGYNDKFIVKLDNPVFFRIMIFERSGKLVYESMQSDQYWNGSNYKTGEECEDGYYTYNIEFQ